MMKKLVHRSDRSARRPLSLRRKAMVLGALLVGVLVPTLVVQVQAHALTVFCVAPSWSDGNGGTMARSSYPSPISTKIRDVWHEGVSGDTKLVKHELASRTRREYIPQYEKKRECPKDAAAPCVVTDVVTITAETWKVQKWDVHGNGGGSIFGISLGVSGGYGEEYGKRDTQSYTLSNMVPYGIGKTVIPSSFIDWKVRSGVAQGGFFKTGATCRANGEFGQQYEYRDDVIATWTAEENAGSGGTWVFDGDVLEKWI